MKHLILDNNIWLNLLKDSGEENNPLEVLLFWIESNHIKILLPDIIIEEWNRNKENKKSRLIRDWKDFFNRAKKFFKSDVVKELRTPEYLNMLVEAQLDAIESIFSNHAVILPITQEIKLKAVKLAEQKKAPFGNKNSIGDAYIFLSMVQYIESNSVEDPIFITDNHTDFSHKNKKDRIHPDLATEFTRLGIQYYIDIKRCFHELSKSLPDFSEYKQLKDIKEEGRKLTKAVLNPETLKDLKGFRDSYLDNILHLDLVLKQKKPTKQQVYIVLGLIEENISYKEYFLKKVESDVWFKIFKKRGYFDPGENPIPISVEDGYQIPYWVILSYLEKLSLKIKEGEHQELIPEILAIIKEVSDSPKDNYRTWHGFIKILSNLPNASVPLGILDYIPTWVNSQFDTILQSSELCENLLPKFLNDTPSEEDIPKAEKILSYLFNLEKREITKENSTTEPLYYSPFRLHWVKNVLIGNNLTDSIARYLSIDLVYQLADALKTLLLTPPHGFGRNFMIDEKEFNLNAKVDGKNLLMTTFPQDDEQHDTPKHSIVINDYEKYDTINLFNLVKGEFVASEGRFFDSESFNKAVTDILYSIEHSTILYDIEELGESRIREEEPKHFFSLVLRDVLLAKAKYDPLQAMQILTSLATNPKYTLWFFKRFVFYTLSEYWTEELKSLFWEMVKDQDATGYFLNSQCDKEIYFLLQKHGNTFTQDEKEIVATIISTGHEGKKRDYTDDTIDYWQLKWYSALKDVDYFKEQYTTLSGKLNLTHEHYEQYSKVRIMKGAKSLFSVEEILTMENQQIIEHINAFNPIRAFGEPSISGLSKALEDAVQRNPQKFSKDITLYSTVPYIYAYHLVRGFTEAFKNNQSIDWEKILNYCFEYVSSSTFGTDALLLENDSWNATSDWVVGAIGLLITEGTRSDERGLDSILLPRVKKILFKVIPMLNRIEDFEKTNMGYPTYLVNSTAGKMLRALLDYSLKNARTIYEKTDEIKWETTVRNLFESTLEKGIIDGYILQGMYFQQFYYLDKQWIIHQIKSYSSIENKHWLAFMGGYTFNNPVSSKEVYTSMIPHYERALQQDIEFERLGDNGVVRHLAVYYLWEFESIGDDNLIAKFLDTAKTKKVESLIYFVSSQKKYVQSLETIAEKTAFYSRVVKLWEHVLERFKSDGSEESKNVLEGLSTLLGLFLELDERLTQLVTSSVSVIDKGNHTYEFLENLVRFKNNQNNSTVATYIGQLLKEMMLVDRLPIHSEKNIIELVIFLYENNIHITANDICNTYSERGYYFLKETYKKYN